ncbi:2090_t:CDS:2, partial [Scutellospora calospora]
TCPFTHFIYQYEKSYEAKDNERDIYIQGFFKLKKQNRIGKKEDSSIKKILQVENIIEKIHFDDVSSMKDSIIYCKKTYNKCKIHNQQLVDLDDPRRKEKGNLNCICIWYNKKCISQRILARYNEDSGPFEYLIESKESKYNNKSNEKLSDDEVIINNAKDQLKWAIINGLANITAIRKAVKSLERKKMKRYWKPYNMFLYSDNSRVGKGYLLSVLFPNAYKRRNNSGRFWQSFTSSYKEVLVNEFKGQEKYLETLNLLDCKEYSVQIKGSDINFCPFVIAYTANTIDKSKYILGPIKLYYPDLYIPNNRVYVADRARRRLKENPLGHEHGIPFLELNKNNIEQDIITNEEMQEEMELDIADEEIYQEFDRKNRNNLEFKCMKSLFKTV